jgi:hypothetical protein
MHVNRETDTHRAIVGFGDCCRRIRPNREARLFMSKRRQYFDTDVEARHPSERWPGFAGIRTAPSGDVET